MNKKVDELLTNISWFLEEEVSFAPKKDLDYLNDYFINISDSDLSELLFFSKFKDENWVKGLHFCIFYFKHNDINYDIHMDRLLDAFNDCITRKKDTTCFEFYYYTIFEYFKKHISKNIKFIIDYINIVFSFIINYTEEEIYKILNISDMDPFIEEYLEYYYLSKKESLSFVDTNEII